MRGLLTQLGQRLLIGLVLWYLILLVMGKPVYAHESEVNAAEITTMSTLTVY